MLIFTGYPSQIKGRRVNQLSFSDSRNLLTRIKVYSIWKYALAHVCPCRAGETLELLS